MSSSAPPTARPVASNAARSRWEFEERHPWEQGFAGYYRDWIAPELARLEATRRAGEQGFRRWLPLLLAVWLALTLLIADVRVAPNHPDLDRGASHRRRRPGPTTGSNGQGLGPAIGAGTG